MNNNRIKNAVEKLSLSEAARLRITSALEEAEESRRSVPRVRWTLAAAAVLVALLTLGTLAATGVFRRAPGDNTAHIGTASDPAVVDVQTGDNTVLSDDGEHLFTVNAVTGGQDKVYIDCTLTRKDGGVITGLSSDEAELPVFRAIGMLRLSNGEERQVYFFTLSDSSETEYHLEGMCLIVKPWKDGMDEEEYRKNKFYSAEEMKELLDGAKLSPGVIGASFYRTESIALSQDLAGALSLCEPGDAVPFTEDRYIYDNWGNAYLRQDFRCSLGVGEMDAAFSQDGSITVNNYGYGPYHLQRADHSDVQALYLNLKGYEEVTFGANFKLLDSDGTETSLSGTVTDCPAPGIVTLAIHDNSLDDMTVERLAEVFEARTEVYEENVVSVFSGETKISGDFKNAVVEKSFDPVTVALENGQIILKECHMTNTEIRLFGSCTAAGQIELPLDEAYAVTDSGETVMLGGKCGTGTYPDGVFEISWQCKTVLDPEVIAEIHIGNAVIKLK